MARYACVDSKGSFIFAEQFREYEKQPPDVSGKGWTWLPAPIVPKPNYDPATQMLSGPTYAVTTKEVVESWSVTDKTAQQLDDEKSSEVTALTGVLFQVIFNLHNRIRALEGQQPHTAAQVRAAIKAML